MIGGLRKEREWFYYAFFVVVIITALASSLLVLLIWKASKVVKFLKLEQGFDSEEFRLNRITDKTLATLTSILFGGYYFLEALPTFINQSLSIFEAKASLNAPLGKNLLYWWIVSLLQMLIGAYLVVSFKQVQKWVLKQS